MSPSSIAAASARVRRACSPAGCGSSGARAMNCLLARESAAFYGDVVERLRMRVDPGFPACGYLFLAHSEETLARLHANVELQNGLGVPSRIVSPAEAAELVPGSRFPA